jgi:hypothetical protein
MGERKNERKNEKRVRETVSEGCPHLYSPRNGTGLESTREYEHDEADKEKEEDDFSLAAHDLKSSAMDETGATELNSSIEFRFPVAPSSRSSVRIL